MHQTTSTDELPAGTSTEAAVRRYEVTRAYAEEAYRRARALVFDVVGARTPADRLNRDQLRALERLAAAEDDVRRARSALHATLEQASPPARS